MKNRILLTGDWHCGHRMALTPPDLIAKNNQIAKKIWKIWESGLSKFGPFDTVIVNGDLIEGSGRKNGGVELLTTDRSEQSEMAISICKHLEESNKGKKPYWYFTYGTPYHTGDAENFEDIVFKSFPNENGIKNHENILTLDLYGVKAHIRHHTSSSSGLGNRNGGPVKEMIQRIIEESYRGKEKADLIVRSHVHYYTYMELYDRTVMTLPAMQYNSDYGEKRCTGNVDLGFVVMDIEDGKISKVIPYKITQPLEPEKFISVCAK